jgi:hypothetical protein
MKQIQVERPNAQQGNTCSIRRKKKKTSRKLYVQKYDKKLFTSKHPLYNPQRQIALSTFTKTTLK